MHLQQGYDVPQRVQVLAGVRVVMTPDEDGIYWVSVSEAARRLGCSRQAIQKRITRGTIPTRVNNRGDRLVQAVAGAAPVSSAPVPVTKRPSAAPVQPTPELERSGLISLDDVHRLLGEQSERLEKQHAALVVALQAAHREAVGMLVERVDAAEVRAERVEEKLDQVMASLLDRQQDAADPWWRRWFGSSRRSAIRGDQ